jgi:hypothetical protein
MRAFRVVRFPLGLFLAAAPNRRVPCAAAVANAANRLAPARPGFLIVLLRALSAWGV